MPKFTNYTIDFNKVHNSWISDPTKKNYYHTTPEGATAMKVFGVIMLAIFIVCLFL